MNNYQIFISYRRDGADSLAGRISDRFNKLGYKVFFDVESMRSGEFNKQIFKAIDMCEDFLLILPPKGLDRCIDENDWVRNELSYAIKQKKNIIPIMMRDFVFPDSLPKDIEAIRYMEGVCASNEYFDAFIERLQTLIVSKRASETSYKKLKLCNNYISFIASITIDDYLNAKKFFESGNDITTYGGILLICKNILKASPNDSRCQEKISNLLQVQKIIYKIAEDKGFYDICAFMQSTTKDLYLSAQDNIKEYLLKKYDKLNCDFINYIFKSISESFNNPLQKDYWETFLEEVFILRRTIFTDAEIESINLESSYKSFISSVGIDDYFKVKKLCDENSSNRDSMLGVFYICKMLLEDSKNSLENKIYFTSIESALNIIYELAKAKEHFEICVLMQSISKDVYLQASDNIKEYMISQIDSLNCEFLNLLFRTLSSLDNSSPQYNDTERLLKEIFCILHACQIKDAQRE